MAVAVAVAVAAAVAVALLLFSNISLHCFVVYIVHEPCMNIELYICKFIHMYVCTYVGMYVYNKQKDIFKLHFVLWYTKFLFYPLKLFSFK